jgi:hypothetical protein
MIYGQPLELACDSLYCQNILSIALLQEAVHTCWISLLCWSHKATWPVDTTRDIPSGAAGMQWLSDISHLTWFIVTFGDIVLCLCERLSSHSCVDVGSCLLGCTLCWWISSCRILLPSPVGSGQPNLHRLSGVDSFEQEDGGSKIIWIFSNYLLFDMTAHPRWLESSLKSYVIYSQFFIIWFLTLCSRVQNINVVINNERIACRN